MIVSISLVAILTYIIPVESLFTAVLGQNGPPPNVPPPDRGENKQYGKSKECPPGQANKPGPVPPGLVGRCP